MRKLLTLFIVCLLYVIGNTQEMRIGGHVVDTNSRVDVPLPNALAMLIRISDSVLVDFQRTDQAGNFQFDRIAIDTFQLLISHPRHGEQSYYLFGSNDNKEIFIPRVIIPPVSKEFQEVVIFAYRDPIYYRGDTLIYVADSFQTRENAVVEDLLKKLPGIQVTADGSIKSQGKTISQVLVDGDEFFGADATIATKNLAASGVESVKVYEKKSENAVEGEETIQVLDLTLKDEAKKGYFGKVSAAGDFNRFYEGELLANKFNKKQKISVFSLVSNTTRSSLEWRDAYKFGIETGWGYDDENDSWMRTSNDLSGTGVPQTLKSGIYFTDQITKKLNITSNYTYSNSSLLATERSRTEFFLSDTSYVTEENTSTDKRQESHVLNFKVEYQLDSLTTLEVEPKYTRRINHENRVKTTGFVDENQQIVRQTEVKNSSTQVGDDFSARVSLVKKFMKKDRRLLVNYRFSNNQNDQRGNLYSLDQTLSNPLLNDSIDQLKENRNTSSTHRFMVSFLEPITAKWKVEVEYELNRNDNSQDKLTFNASQTGYDVPDFTLTNRFATDRLQQLAGAQLIYEYKKHRFSTGVRVRNVVLDNVNLLTGTLIPQNVTNVLPRAVYTFKMTQNNRFSVRYTTSSSLPSVNQLQPVPDNSNPNRIMEGNPDLKPNFTHRMSARFNMYKPVSGRYLYADLSASSTQNAFANETVFDNFGRQVSKTVNVDGNFSANLNVGGGFPIFKQVFEVSPNLNAGYSEQKNIINAQVNNTVNRFVGGGLELAVETDSLNVSLAANLSYYSPTSTISTASSLPYTTQSVELFFRWILPLRIVVETDATYTVNSRRAAGYDINFFIWNASINRVFLKRENLIFGIHAYDLLNQNISAQRFVEANYITDQQTNIIARYFLAKLTYKFNSTKAKETNDELY